MSHKQQPNLQTFSEINFDNYAEGCNDRISFSMLVTADAVKYMINVQNNLITQRYLNLVGSAALGTFEIDFGESDILAGSVGINSILSDYIRYNKTISSSAFDYTDTNCNIAGWIIDYKAHSRSPGTTSIATNPDNAVDGNILTFADIETASTPPIDIWQIELDNAISISDMHFAGYIEDDHVHDATAHHQILTSPDNITWTERGASPNQAGGLNYYVHITGLSLTGIKYVKIQGSNTWLTQKIFDASFK